MNRQVAGLALIVAAAGFCVAQNPAAIAGHLPFHSELSAIVQSEPQSSASAQNATVIRIVLSKSLDAKKLKEGDPVEAKTETELSANGLVAPRGSVIKGHVTQASARSKGGQESSLGIAFDAIVLKNGQPMTLKTSIQAVGAPPLHGPGHDGWRTCGTGYKFSRRARKSLRGLPADARTGRRLPSTTFFPAARHRWAAKCAQFCYSE
jgi:hypothetical protein